MSNSLNPIISGIITANCLVSAQPENLKRSNILWGQILQYAHSSSRYCSALTWNQIARFSILGVKFCIHNRNSKTEQHLFGESWYQTENSHDSYQNVRTPIFMDIDFEFLIYLESVYSSKPENISFSAVYRSLMALWVLHSSWTN